MNIKELYSKDVNIQNYFREKNGTNKNEINSILYSYDFQAGSYTEEYFNNEVIKDTYIVEGKKKDITTKEVVELRSQYVSEELKLLKCKNVLEIGTGEATNLCDIALKCDGIKFTGLELSLSRLLYAQNFARSKKADIDFVMGNMFSLPFFDNSFDAILLIHCLESNTDREYEALKEILRVSRKYVILLEPSYELGNEATKKRIMELGYINHLQRTIKEMNLDVIKNELFKITTYNNNTAITVIKKERKENGGDNTGGYSCPECNNKLHPHKEAFFCPECYNLYPIIHNIPVLNANHAILCSKYECEDFLE